MNRGCLQCGDAVAIEEGQLPPQFCSPACEKIYKLDAQALQSKRTATFESLGNGKRRRLEADAYNYAMGQMVLKLNELIDAEMGKTQIVMLDDLH